MERGAGGDDATLRRMTIPPLPPLASLGRVDTVPAYGATHRLC